MVVRKISGDVIGNSVGIHEPRSAADFNDHVVGPDLGGLRLRILRKGPIQEEESDNRAEDKAFHLRKVNGQA